MFFFWKLRNRYALNLFICILISILSFVCLKEQLAPTNKRQQLIFNIRSIQKNYRSKSLLMDEFRWRQNNKKTRQEKIQQLLVTTTMTKTKTVLKHVKTCRLWRTHMYNNLYLITNTSTTTNKENNKKEEYRP